MNASYRRGQWLACPAYARQPLRAPTRPRIPSGHLLYVNVVVLGHKNLPIHWSSVASPTRRYERCITWLRIALLQLGVLSIDQLAMERNSSALCSIPKPKFASERSRNGGTISILPSPKISLEKARACEGHRERSILRVCNSCRRLVVVWLLEIQHNH